MADSPQVIADRIIQKMSADQGSGYANVGGSRINYQDIGSSSDPLRNRGGYAFSTGGAVSPPETYPGIATQDAMNRQTMLDASGVGAGGTRPRSLESRLQGVRGGGPGALVAAVMASKVARSENQQFEKDRAYELAAENSAATNNYNAGMLELNRATSPYKTAQEQSAVELNKARQKKLEWEMSPAGVAARKNKDGITDTQKAEMQAIDEAAKGLRSLQTDVMKQEGKLDAFGNKIDPEVYRSMRSQQNEQRRALERQMQAYADKWGEVYSGSAPIASRSAVSPAQPAVSKPAKNRPPIDSFWEK